MQPDPIKIGLAIYGWWPVPICSWGLVSGGGWMCWRAHCKNQIVSVRIGRPY